MTRSGMPVGIPCEGQEHMPPRRGIQGARGWAAVALVAALAGGGCAARPTGPPSGHLDDSVFRSADEIFRGYCPIVPGAEPRPGDRVLLGVDIRRGKSNTVRYVEVILGEGFAPPWRVEYTRPRRELNVPAFPATIIQHDDRPGVVNRTSVTLPEVVLDEGFYDAAQVLYDSAGAPPVEGFRDEICATGIMAILCMARAYAMDETLTQSLLATVEPPSLLGLAFGDKFSFTWGEHEPFRRTTYLFGGWIPMPAFRVSARVIQGSRPLVELDAVVVEPVAPLGLCGGVVAIDARNPAHPDRSVRIRLLGALRGEGKKERPRT